MIIKILSTLLLMGANFSLVACSKFNEPETVTSQISAASITADATLTPEQKAEELAKQAEQLISAQGFMEAHEMATRALNLDPKNFRAQFVQALAAPWLLEKGILTRIKPLSRKNPDLAANFDQLFQQNQDRPDSALKIFLLDGKPDIVNEEDLQNFADEVWQAFEKTRIFLKNSEAQELTILSPAVYFEELAKRYVEACKIVTKSAGEYEMTCPPDRVRREVTINRADIQALQGFAAGMQIGIVGYTSYDLTGLAQFATNFENFVAKNPRDVIEVLLKNPKFGRLRSQNQLATVKKLYVDALAAVKWADTQQKDLCPEGKPAAANRPGNLLNTGFCTTGFSTYLPLYQQILDGKPIASSVGQKPSQINILRMFESPVKDLKSFAPIRYDNCGQVIGIADNTFNGMYPNGDHDEVLKDEMSRKGYRCDK